MTAQRGICPVCGEERQITKAGGMRDHRGDMWVGGWRQQCGGIGQPPKAVVADPVAAAEERGYARAIADLRAEGARALDRYTKAGSDHPGWAMYDSAADYLESIAPGETTP